MISVSARTLPEAWEAAVLAVVDRGRRVRTDYDKEDDPPSYDETVAIEVLAPFGEPRVHKNFPGGPEELETYVQEVLWGIHDHWDCWPYTYHRRLWRADQMNKVLAELKRNPQSRRAQAITWDIETDPGTKDPPCLQRLWFRVFDGALQMNAHWRSRDLWRAWFMNAYAMTELQALMARALFVEVGAYVDISDSLHVYGSTINEAEYEKMRTRPLFERVWRTEVFDEMVAETRVKLTANPDYMRSK